MDSNNAPLPTRDNYQKAESPPFAPVFVLNEVTFAYDHLPPVLNRISLEIGRGEKIALLGANGSGKSTLLKLISGLLFPTHGAILGYNVELTEQALRNELFSQRFRQRVGFVFQNSDAQLFSPTVLEELAFGPQQLGLSENEVAGRVTDVAAMFGIEPLLARSPFHLSGGEKKRVALASVLASNPEVLLLDEPTGGLDPRSRQALVEMLLTLHRAGKTLITATHDLDIVPAIADRAYVLNETGSLVGTGTPREIMQNAALLKETNLVHTHYHWHGDVYHSHPHHHGGEHDHTHEWE